MKTPPLRRLVGSRLSLNDVVVAQGEVLVRKKLCVPKTLSVLVG